MLRDAALLQLELLRRAARARARAQGRDALQRPVARHSAGLRRRGLVRAAARGRAVGGLPPVLLALPLPAPPPVLEGHALPAVCSAAASRASRRRRCAACSRPATASARRAHPRRAAQPPGAPLRRARRRRQARAALGRLPAGADRGQRAAARAARLAPRWAPGALHVVGLRGDDELLLRRRGPQGAVRGARRPRPSGPRSPGTWAATRAGTRASRPSTPATSWPWTPTTSSSTACTEALAREGVTNILPLTADAVDPSPALGWRGARATARRRARAARPRALPSPSSTTSRSAATCPSPRRWTGSAT